MADCEEISWPYILCDLDVCGKVEMFGSVIREDVLSIFFLSLKFFQTRLKRVESCYDGFCVGNRKPGEIICRHMGSLFVLDHNVMLKQCCLESIHRLAVEVTQFL